MGSITCIPQISPTAGPFSELPIQKMTLLINIRTTSIATYILSTWHSTLWLFFLLQVSTIWLFYHLTVSSSPSSHSTLHLRGLEFSRSFCAKFHQMANMDHASMDLILALQLEDINVLQEEHVDGAMEDFGLDMNLAVELYREELRVTANVINDYRYAETVGGAIGPEDLPFFPTPSATPLFDEAYAQHIHDTIDSYEAVSEDGRPQSDVPMEKCAACLDDHKESDIMTAPCDHTYCRECVDHLLNRAATHEFHFPPKCCGRIITLENAERLLSTKTYNKFQEKSKEFSTPNRTYCFDTECITFIPTETIQNDEAKCPACQKLTCVVCKEEAHEGDCHKDTAVQSLMAAAGEAGFQQCRECKRIIELMSGCNHITCTCGADFCYLCGVKWKTCNCDMGIGGDWEGDEHEHGHEHENVEYWVRWAAVHVEEILEDGRIVFRQENR